MLEVLCADPARYGVWAVYSRLVQWATAGVVDKTTDEMATLLGSSRMTVFRALKILRQLELVEGPHAVGEGWSTRVYCAGTATTLATLHAVAAGKGTIDVAAGQITFDSGQEVLALDGVTSVVHSGASSSSFSSIALSNTETSIALLNTTAPEKQKFGRNGKKYNPVTDEHRPTIERIQVYANELFKTKHALLNDAGQEIGKSHGVSSRYGIIRRALVEWGFSEEQLKGALLMASKDPWWTERKINDTVNLFRKIQHIQRWVDAWASGGKLATGRKWDRKQVGMGASSIIGDNGQVDRSKVTEEVF